MRLLEPGPELALQVKSENLAVKASKTSGEPGLVMAVSAFLAIKKAILAARLDLNGDDSWFDVDLPATSEKIQTFCGLEREHLNL